MPLHRWQADLQARILSPDTTGDLIHERLLAGSIDKQSQLNIYANAYVLRLTEALRSNYPALHQLLGDDDFDSMAKAYLNQHPSVHASIRWFGDVLAGFLKAQYPYRQTAVFAELARFEWALRHTIDAADTERVTVEALQAIEPEAWGELYFSLHPSITLMHLEWNTPHIWNALMEAQKLPDRVKYPMRWLVYRQADLVSSWRSVSELELSALTCLQNGGSFADICELVNDVPQAAGFLRMWVEQGLISFTG